MKKLLYIPIVAGVAGALYFVSPLLVLIEQINFVPDTLFWVLFTLNNLLVAAAVVVFSILLYQEKKPVFAVTLISLLVYKFFSGITLGISSGIISDIANIVYILARMTAVAALTLLGVFFYQKRHLTDTKDSADKE